MYLPTYLKIKHFRYLSVDEAHNSSLFFWYVPSESDYEDDLGRSRKKPLILWLQGGPGWPTMYGLFKVRRVVYVY